MAWAPDYVTVEELKAFIKVGDSIDDDELALIPGTVSRAIDQHCSRQFGAVDLPQERFYRPRWSRRHARWVADVDDFAPPRLKAGSELPDPPLRRNSISDVSIAMRCYSNSAPVSVPLASSMNLSFPPFSTVTLTFGGATVTDGAATLTCAAGCSGMFTVTAGGATFTCGASTVTFAG